MEITNYSATGKSRRKETKCESIIDIPLIPEPARWPDCCIYRVPNKIREINKEAYTPKLVSIGPFHHKLEELEGVRKQKLIYFKEFCSRTGKSQKDLASIVEQRKEEISHCYSETTFDLTEEKFVEKILLDAVFIIELLLRNFERKNCPNFGKYGNDYILSNAWLESHIKEDLMLLENQLPFKFLKKLYEAAEEHQFLDQELMSLNELACEFFFSDKHRIHKDREGKHFTDLHRMFYCPTLPKDGPKKRIEHLRFTATRLDEAGLEFKALKDKDLGGRSLLDIEYSKDKCLEYYRCLNLSWLFSCLPYLRSFRCFKSVQCILKVPQLIISDHTEALFRNLMAFELCHYPSTTHICNYVLLMNFLIKAEQDVDLLVAKNVIVNYIGSNAKVGTLLSELCSQILETQSCYNELCLRLNEHCENCWNRIKASIKRTYFRDFGRCIATVAALLTLVGLFIPFLTK